MVKLYGNSLWNLNVNNRYKSVIVLDKNALAGAIERLEAAGLNYCAYEVENNAYVAVNRFDREIIKQLNLQSKDEIKAKNKPYKPNYIIGNVNYNDISDKSYQKYSTDFAYKLAQRLEEQGISFSGRIYGKSTTITVDKDDSEKIKAIADVIKEQRSSPPNFELDNSFAADNAVNILQYSDEQKKAIGKSVELIKSRNGEENILEAFSSAFENTNEFTIEQLSALSVSFVNTYKTIEGIGCTFADVSKITKMKRDFSNENLAKKVQAEKGFSENQTTILRQMLDAEMGEAVYSLLDYTFSEAEMKSFLCAYKGGSYEQLINVVAEVKGKNFSEIDESIKSGEYEPLIPDYELLQNEYFFHNPDNEQITHIYYNPDCNSGGQFVVTDISYEQIREAAEKYPEDTEHFFDYLEVLGNQSAADIGSDFFKDAIEVFMSGGHFCEGLTEETKARLLNVANAKQAERDSDIMNEFRQLINTHKDFIDKSDFERKTVVINAFAGPGAGKTTSCLEIASKLKKQGYVTDYVQEYAKELVYDGRIDLLDGNIKNQFGILEEQLRRVDRLYGKVDFIVTDSPVLLNATYLKDDNEEYKNNVLELYNHFDNFNYFVERDTSSFETEGRIHNLEQSLEIDEKLKETLSMLNLQYKAYTHATIDNIVTDAIAYIQNRYRPTVTCEWSEHPAFEDGKMYSLAEFDSIMKQADSEWVAKKQYEIDTYGDDVDKIYQAYENGEIDGVHIGYSKVKFTLNMPDGRTFTERQDIGNGYGSVVDFLSRYQKYDEIVPLLKKNLGLSEEGDKADNFTIEDGEKISGAKTKFKNNVASIQLLKRLEAENRNATPEEQQILSLYSGWGGLANAFEPHNEKWSKEYTELKELLDNDEYRSAKASVLDSFYTDNAVIDSIYSVLEQNGFKGGNVLEPAMGIGNFFGRMPQSLQDTTALYGVEKDSLSGRMAQKLYPNANIQIKGIEETNFQNDSFDIAIGNIPFGDFGVNDMEYNNRHLKIHDYFFLKALDKVRDGGVVAFVTSKGTLDKRDSSFRKLLAEKADLVGAIRLPNNAFKSAGTEVTSDIVFLQKRSEPPAHIPSWVNIKENENGLTVNSYFAEHSEMVMGNIVAGNKLYGREDDTMCVPFSDGRSLRELLSEAVKNIKFDYRESDKKLSPIENEQPVDLEKIRPESYYISENKLYFYGSNENGSLNSTTADVRVGKRYSQPVDKRIRDFIELRDTLRELLNIQQLDCTDEELHALQNKLNTQYDDFYKKYGLLHNTYNHSVLGADGGYHLVSSLEQEIKDDKLIKKSDIFTQRVNVPRPVIEHVDTATEALAVSMAEKGTVDLAYMSKLTGISEKTLAESLCASGELFALPGKMSDDRLVYQPASEYLSGDIYEKLDYITHYAEKDDRFLVNCRALEAAVPTPLNAGDIDINLGATWIDIDFYREFMYEKFKTPMLYREDCKWSGAQRIKLEYSEHSGRWAISGKGLDKSLHVMNNYGAHDVSAYQIFEAALNLTEPKVYKNKLDENGRVVRDKDGKPVRVLDVEATQVVKQKSDKIRREFKDWIFANPERRRYLVEKYNRTFNCIKPREYDGSRLTFPGMNASIELHEHQKNAIAHAIYGGNTLFAHSVGAGKTFEMIATAMECKRLGMCNKSLFAVPNHLTEQVGDDFLRLYPNANILVATKDDFKTANRKRLMAKIATGNYDAVIIGHSQLKMLPLSPERQKDILQTQIDDIVSGIADIKLKDGNGFKVKEMERTKRTLENQLIKLSSSKKDNSIYFEELGIDKLFVDEAHEFKNLFCATKLSNVSGISSRASQRASELFAKCRYLDEKTGGKGVVFATGTPV